MLVPSTTTNAVDPPSCGGASSHQAAPRTASVRATPVASRSRSLVQRWSCWGSATCVAAAPALTRVDPLTASYCAATTVSCVAATAVACGVVVLQVALPAAFVQVYQEPAAASCTLSVLVVVGAIENAT